MPARTASSLLRALACAALLCAGSAAAATNDARLEAARQSDRVLVGHELKAGEFAWLPASEMPGTGPVTMWVNLHEQRASLFRDGQRIAVTTVSTGRPGHDTPTGVFPILGKQRTYYSKKYDNAPMPWMQRLTDWGHALHAGNVRPDPASHGCVRLPAEFAKQLFSLTSPGDLVVITQDDSPKSLAVALKVAGMDQRTALMVGVTEPLPQIVFVKPGEEYPTTSAEIAAGGLSGF